MTNADGVATYQTFPPIILFAPTYTAAFAGDSTDLPATATGTFSTFLPALYP